MTNVLNTPTNKGKVLLAYIVIYFVWGSTFFFIHKALSDFTPFVLGSFRFLTAALLIFAFCKLKGYKLYEKKAVTNSCIVGFLLLFVDMATLIWAEQHVSSGIAAIMAAAAAIWFIIMDKPKWKENFSSFAIILGLIAGFIGVIMLFAEQVSIAGDKDQRNLNIFCMFILIIGSIAWTSGSLYSKYSAKVNRINPKEDFEDEPEDLNIMVKSAWQMLTAGIAFSLVATFDGEFASMDLSAVSTQGWLSMTYLIVFGSILAFSSYIWLLQVRPATEVSTYAYVNPIVAVALSYFFTDDVITHLQIWGLVVILLSVLLMNWKLYSQSKLVKTVRTGVKSQFKKRRVFKNAS